jgi:quinol monooxygenase YgiN
MATFIVRHKVKDYAVWKKVFAEHGKVRAQHGFTKSRVYRYVDDPNHVIIVSELKDINQAKAMAASPGLVKAMKDAGVIEEPKLFYLDDGESFPN